jgi:hypothetical protein
MGAENTDINVTLVAWAKIVLEIWFQKMEQLQMYNYTNQLADSLTQHVISEAGGHQKRIEFFFLYYGKFVDMGVGNGVKIDASRAMRSERRDDRYSTRKAKPWYSKPLYGQIARLRQIMAEKYAHRAAIAIIENVDDNALSWSKQWSRA